MNKWQDRRHRAELQNQVEELNNKIQEIVKVIQEQEEMLLDPVRKSLAMTPDDKAELEDEKNMLANQLSKVNN